MERFSFIEVGIGPFRNHNLLADHGPVTCTLAYELYDTERSDEDTADFRDRAVEDWLWERLDHQSAQSAQVIGATFDGNELLVLNGVYWFLDDEDQAHELGTKFERALERLHDILKLPTWHVLTNDEVDLDEVVLRDTTVDEVEERLAQALPGALTQRYQSAHGLACAALDAGSGVFAMARVEDPSSGDFLVQVAGPTDEVEEIVGALQR